ncbi:hypothetical protein DGWBC_0883 [Dehalogenimonas sp. WBC-2]|nr:hypothetical protein DGWBC_0883 [Dehalogenimonas sp. WBC-2]
MVTPKRYWTSRSFRIVLEVLGSGLMLCLTGFPIQPVHALNPFDYFSVEYHSFVSKSQVLTNQTFDVTVTGTAICIKDLPFSPGNAIVSGRIVAIHENGTSYILDSNYTVGLGGFPTKAGQSVQASETVSITFSSSYPLGHYTLRGELIQAKVQMVVWFDVSSYLPPSQDFGTIDLIAASPPPPTTPVPIVLEPEPPVTIPSATNPIITGEPNITVSRLVLSSIEARVNGSITVSTDITNSGTAAGNSELKLYLDDILLTSKSVYLVPNETQRVDFIITPDSPGFHKVQINNLNATFIVLPNGVIDTESPTPPIPESSIDLHADKMKSNSLMTYVIYILNGVLIVILFQLLRLKIWRRK